MDLFVPANDDEPTEAWLELRETDYWYEQFKAVDKGYTARLKTGRADIGDKERERSTANFIWFMKFEIEFDDNPPPPDLRTV